MKKLIWIVGFCLAFVIPTIVRAQAPTPAPTEFTLKISNDDVNTIGRALGKLPFDEVASLIQKLRQQIVEQQTPAKPVEGPAVAPPTPPK